MKKYLCYLLFICPFLLQAQLLTKWNVALSEPFAAPESGKYEILPTFMLSDQNKTVYLSSLLIWGWQVSAQIGRASCRERV